MNKKPPRLPKFNILAPDGNAIKYNYGKIYRIEQTTESDRLVAAADEDQTNLLLKLAETLNPPYYILYVLLTSRLGNQRGRYQSPLFETIDDLRYFLNKYADFFETDARHHLWIGTLDNSGLLVYDQHNVIYAYGNSENYVHTLSNEGFHEQDFHFPTNHCHYYHPENDKFEEAILKEIDWQIFALAENDEY